MCVAFVFFFFQSPCALLVLYRYFLSLLNLEVCSLETNCECMKSAFEQCWEMSKKKKICADGFRYSCTFTSHFLNLQEYNFTFHFLFMLKNNEQGILIIFVFIYFVLSLWDHKCFCLFWGGTSCKLEFISVIDINYSWWKSDYKCELELTTGSSAWLLFKKKNYCNISLKAQVWYADCIKKKMNIEW